MYSKDFREAVVKHRKEGHTIPATAKKFNVGESTVEAWTHEFDAGKVKEKYDTSNRKPWKVDDEKLKEIVKENPDKLPKDIAIEFGCSDDAIRIAMKRCGITRKKK